MADINVTSGKSSRGNKPRARRLQTRIDMTPMVDLGFLLITFFILTTTLMKYNTLQITVPNKKGEEPVPASNSVTILMDKDNNLYYYFGMQLETGKGPELVKTNYTADGIRQMLLQRNKDVNEKIRILKSQYQSGSLNEKQFQANVKKVCENPKGPVISIKATDESTYNNMVNIFDEMKICNIARYALVDITPYDKELIKKYKKF